MSSNFHLEKITREKKVPKNFSITGSKIKQGDRLKIYGIPVNVMHIRKHTRPEDLESEKFEYYMISVDPQGLGWYHITKTTDANIKKL